MRKIASLLAMFMLFAALTFGQDRTITGTVTDEAGLPVAGASVRIKGTRTGVAADNNGQFRILAKAGDVILVTGAGIEPAEITVGASSTVTISVKKAVLTGSEVVVTALGIRRTEKALGYAVSKVDPNTVLQKSEPDLLKGLQGKVPGVDIRQSQGVPGSATRIQIRGNSTFSLETQPLIVVDGVPYSNTQLTTSSQTSAGGAYGSGLANLDPNDIESFNILKGAAAASLYGSRASRGVIVITTKSGSGKKGAKSLNVTLKSSASIENIANLPEYQNSYGTGAQNRAGGGSNGSWGGKFGSGNVYDAGGNVVRASTSGVDSVPAWGTYLTAYPELFDANGRTGYKAYPNNVKDLFNTGRLFENSIGVNGGEGNTVFNLTVSNVNHLGYVENSSYTRNNISVGGQTKYKNLTIGGNIGYTRSKQKSGFFGIAQAFTTQFGRSLIMGRSWDIAGFPSEDRAGRPLSFIAGQYTNPIWGAYHNTITTREERIVANFRASYKLNSWININYNLGANSSGIFRDEIIDEFSPGVGSGLGQITEDGLRQLELQPTLVAVFTPKIGKDWSLDFKVGSDFNQRTSRRQANVGADLVVPGIFSITNTVTKTFSADSRSKRRLVGTFADATLGYKNFAFINVTGRQDRTSTLPYANSSYFYPGISGSLVWTDAFKLKSNWLDYGKIRVGYAKVGNDANPHNGEDLFGISTTNFLGQPYASRGSQTVDPNLTPEFTKELEIGTDLSLFKRRVGIDFTWYDKRSTDLIYPIGVPVTTGYQSFFTNIGEISNVGIEAGLTVRPIVGKNLTWEVKGVFTKNKNIVEKLVDGLIRDNLGSIAYIEAGFPYGYLRGTDVARAPDGQILIDAATGWPIEDQEQRMIGDPNPDWKMGITNNISYKGISLSVVWDMTKGGDFYSETVTSLLGRGVTRDTKDRETNRVVAGVYADPNNIYTPLLVGGKQVPNQTRISTNDLFFSTSSIAGSFAINGHDKYNTFDGTVYRLREITLGYELPRSFVKKLKLSAVSLSVSGRNLWYLAPNVPKYTNYDPEVNSLGSGNLQGIELSAAPTTKRFGVNLNVTF
jgi:TonB-linked SusC/RagA family outer membrane protein